MATIPDLTMVSTLRFASGDHVVDEAILSGHVRGSFLGIEADGAPISFRILHVFDIHAGLIAREQAWFDTAAAIRQLEDYLGGARAGRE